MTLKLPLILLAGMAMHIPCRSQDSHTPTDKIVGFPVAFVRKVNDRLASLDANLDRQTAQYLQKFKKREAKLKKKLRKKDSTAATSLFADADAKYADLAQRLKTPQRYKDYI